MEELTPDEHAEELINTFRKITDGIAAYDYDMVNIKCAIAAVDKIMYSMPLRPITSAIGSLGENKTNTLRYWQQVRDKIEKRCVK